MDTGTTLGIFGVLISVAGIIYSAINHKHIRSKCCGKEYDISIDIDTTGNTRRTVAPEETVSPKN